MASRVSNTKKGEKHEERFGMVLKASFREKLDNFSAQLEKGRSEVLREGANYYMNGYLPVLGRIPCGDLKEAIAATPYYEVVPPLLRPRADLGDFLLEADGDSMSPRIESGDLVILRPNIDYADGEICATQVFHDKNRDGQCDATLKRLFRDHKRGIVRLKAINPEFEPVEFPAEFVRVVGVFRGLIRRDGNA